jgi:hypothetical protein
MIGKERSRIKRFINLVENRPGKRAKTRKVEARGAESDILVLSGDELI